MTAWPEVPLGELLTAATRQERVDPLKEYRLLGVRLDGAGPFLRETKTGSRMSATTLYKVEAGDFIYSRLFAWRGAFGLITTELDGCYVSGEFPTFRAIPNRLDLKFLRYWFRLRTTLDVVLADCTGSTPLTRNRFKEEFFRLLAIPLPPLPEQRRIVARIEELAAKVMQTETCRRDSVDAASVVVDAVRAQEFEAFSKNGSVPLEQVAVLERGKFSHRPRNEPRFFGGAHPWIQIGEIEASNKYIRSWTQTLNDDGLAISRSSARAHC